MMSRKHETKSESEFYGHRLQMGWWGLYAVINCNIEKNIES